MTLGHFSHAFSLAVGSSFLEGNWAYNLVSLLVGVVGFGITIWQLVKTRQSADAARDAAKKTTDAFHRLEIVIDFSNLEKWAESILLSLGNDDFIAAKMRLLDLQNGLARTRELSGSARLVNRDEWELLINGVEEVNAMILDLDIIEIPATGSEQSGEQQEDQHGHLSDAVKVRKATVLECRSTMLSISRVLNTLAARAIKAVEPKTEK